MKKDNKQRGISILGVFFLSLVIILVLSYFNVSIRAVVESPTGQENINYVERTAKTVWDNYLAEPASYLWNDVWLKIIWQPLISKIDNTSSTELQVGQ